MESIFICMNLFILIIISYGIGAYINKLNKCNKFHYVPYRDVDYVDIEDPILTKEKDNTLMNITPNIIRYYHFGDNISDINFF